MFLELVKRVYHQCLGNGLGYYVETYRPTKKENVYPTTISMTATSTAKITIKAKGLRWKLRGMQMGKLN